MHSGTKRALLCFVTPKYNWSLDGILHPWNKRLAAGISWYNSEQNFQQCPGQSTLNVRHSRLFLKLLECRTCFVSWHEPEYPGRERLTKGEQKPMLTKSFKQCVLKNINAKINLVQFERFFSPTFSTLNPVNGLRINANKCAMFHGVFRLTSTVNLTDSRSFFARFLDNLGSRKEDVYPRMQWRLKRTVQTTDTHLAAATWREPWVDCDLGTSFEKIWARKR